MNYNDFITNILNTRGRFECKNEYHERHHIIPKCLGGTDNEDNLIDLYAKEHFIAHKLLADENSDNIKLVQAYAIMAFTSNQYEKRYELTPEEYEEARKKFSTALKERYKNKESHPSYGTHISEERKRRISEANKGNKYCLGRVVSEETRKKISEANKNPSAEYRQYLSDIRKGKGLRGENPNAKAVVRLSDGKIYPCMKDAAEDNNINYSTFRTRVRKQQGFIKYEDYIKIRNNNEMPNIMDAKIL